MALFQKIKVSINVDIVNADEYQSICRKINFLKKKNGLKIKSVNLSDRVDKFMKADLVRLQKLYQTLEKKVKSET